MRLSPSNPRRASVATESIRSIDRLLLPAPAPAAAGFLGQGAIIYLLSAPTRVINVHEEHQG